MSMRERAYGLLPAPMQDVAASIEGRRLANERYGGDFGEMLAGYVDRSSWSHDDVVAFRDARLRAVLKRAARTVPLYSSSEYRGLDEVESAADLEAFPVLTKEAVRDHGDQLHARLPGVEVSYGRTSGTTGSPLVVPKTLASTREQWAVWWRYRGWHGISRSTWSGHFGGRNLAPRGGRVWRIDRSQKRLLFSAFHTNDEHLDEVIDLLASRQVPWLHGFPSVISLVAARLLERGIGGSELGVELITTGSENLGEHQRDLIARSFGFEPMEHYGASEMVANASNCPEGELHVDEDFSVLELVGSEIVGTALVNPAFPLVRYACGDTAELAETTCRCGLPGRVLVSLDGRSDDLLLLKDGSRLGRLGVVLRGCSGIRAGQFVQSRPGSAELHVVPGPGFSDGTTADIEAHVRAYVGDRLDLSVVATPALTRSSAGKVRLVVRSNG